MSEEQAFTQQMYDMATARVLTLPQAVEALQRNARIRPLRETLAKYAKIPPEDGKALQAFLTDALLAQSPQGTKRAGIERKVRMWLKGDVAALSKQGAVQLCFALKLSVEDGGSFLCRTCGEGFHWRDPVEIVYLFALREGLDYAGAQALEQEMRGKGLLELDGPGDPAAYTEPVRAQAEQLGSAAELEDFLLQARGSLGSMHNTAYHLFREYLALLCGPVTPDGLEPADNLSVREVAAAYLHEKLIPRIQRRAGRDPEAQRQLLSAIERDIHQNWPDETALSKMLNRKIDVSRKALILLFLATDGDTREGVLAEDEAELAYLEEDAEQPLGAEEGFEDLYLRLNAMLADCGFAPLDPRTPFDWMILYCMCVDESMLIDGRVQHFLTQLFPQAAETASKLPERPVVL